MGIRGNPKEGKPPKKNGWLEEDGE